jgi:RNA polymerase sigma factor (sigma-70 family)
VSSAVDLPRSGALGRASDAQLTSLIRRGNQEAFAELYERHNALVMAVARASSRERAEDIAQEAWTSAYRALSGPGKSIEHAAPWLATIARNVARDRARRDMRLPEVTNDDIVAAAPAVGGVESALEGKHNLGRLLGAFDELSEEQRVILSLREFGGLTYKQIAEQLGKPESTIEAALFRARRKMAKEYAELDSGRRCRIVQSQLLTGRQLSHVERLRISRHLGRCVTCERVARLEGADELIPAPRLARIAGVIPVPGFLARLLAGGADAVSPLAGKAAVAAVTIVVGTGALVVTQGRDSEESASGSAGAGTTAAAATGSSAAPAVLSAAPNIVLTHRVAPAAKRSSGGGPVSSTGAAAPVASAAPLAPAAANSAPRRASPVRSGQRTTTRERQAPVAPVQQVPAAAAPTSAPAAQAPAAAAPAPAAAAPAPAAAAPAPAAANTGTPATPTPAAAPARTGGPSVTQTPVCLDASCRISP